MTDETKKSEVIDWNAPFRASDFEAALGITSRDLEDEDFVTHADLKWREICERGADSANQRFREIVEKHGIKGVCEKRLYQDRDGEYFVFSSNEQGHPFNTPVPATLLIIRETA